MLPQRNSEASEFCQQQCQLLIAKLSSSSSFIDEVRQLILARPGYFPSLEQVAATRNIMARTLRRRLAQEGSNFQLLLDEIRFKLARDYLEQTCINLEEISDLLGYSEPGNFSHAFKRWSGLAPRQWRKKHTYNNTLP